MNIETIIREHLRWKIAFRIALLKRQHVDFHKAGASLDCELGKWIKNDGGKRYGGNEHFQEMVSQHEQFHTQAAAAAQYMNNEDFFHAEMLMEENSAYATASAAIILNLHRLKSDTKSHLPVQMTDNVRDREAINVAIHDHIREKMRLLKAIHESHLDHDQIDVQKKCGLYRWIDARRANKNNEFNIDLIDSTHNEYHALVHGVVSLLKENKIHDARRVLLENESELNQKAFSLEKILIDLKMKVTHA